MIPPRRTGRQRSSLEGRLAALESRSPTTAPARAVVQVIGPDGRTAAQEQAADCAIRNGVRVVEIKYKDGRRQPQMD